MNKENFLKIIYNKKYDIYNFWERCEKMLDDNLDLLISYYQKEIATENAKLEAKVYTYEKIIANSNFKAVNNKSIDILNKKIKELENELEILKGDNNE